MSLAAKIYGKRGSGLVTGSSTKKSQQNGSLREIFQFYALLNTPEKSMGRGSLTYDEIRLANTTLSLSELIRFAKDFALVPQLLSVNGLNFAWQRQRQKCKENLLKSNRIDFSNFVEILARCAAIVYAHELMDDITRTKKIVDYLQLHDHKAIRFKLRQLRCFRMQKIRDPFLPSSRKDSGIEKVSSFQKKVYEGLQLKQQDERNSVNEAFEKGLKTCFYAGSIESRFSSETIKVFEPFVRTVPSQWKEISTAPGMLVQGLIVRRSYDFKIVVRSLFRHGVYLDFSLVDLPCCTVSFDGLLVCEGLRTTAQLCIQGSVVGVVSGYVLITASRKDKKNRLATVSKYDIRVTLTFREENIRTLN